MTYEKFVFVKELKTNEGSIPVGSELFYVNGVVSLNGGMLTPEYQNVFKTLIANETSHGWNYLKPDTPIYNKC